jgi:hypothetical protein
MRPDADRVSQLTACWQGTACDDDARQQPRPAERARVHSLDRSKVGRCTTSAAMRSLPRRPLLGSSRRLSPAHTPDCREPRWPRPLANQPRCHLMSGGAAVLGFPLEYRRPKGQLASSNNPVQRWTCGREPVGAIVGDVHDAASRCPRRPVAFQTPPNSTAQDRPPCDASPPQSLIDTAANRRAPTHSARLPPHRRCSLGPSACTSAHKGLHA